MVEKMSNFYSLSSLFEHFCESLACDFSLCRVGLVELNPITNEFGYLCLWDDQDGARSDGRTFSREGTVGDWVLRNDRAFVGSNERSVWTFPKTWRDFKRQRYQANFVARYDPEKYRLLFLLSRTEGAFDEPSVIEKHFPILKLLTQFAENCKNVVHTKSQDRVQKLLLNEFQERKTFPSIDEWQQLYLETLVRYSAGKIEGEGGAAKLAGLKPSTFRYRYKKLSKPGGEER